MTAGPRVFGGRCLECGKVTTFTANGPGGALMCDSCGIVYPRTVYPGPDAAHVRRRRVQGRRRVQDIRGQAPGGAEAGVRESLHGGGHGR